MQSLAGLTLALLMSVSGTTTGSDRERNFYPVALIVIAAYYQLFVMAVGSVQILGLETLVVALFIMASLVGSRASLRLATTVLMGHGVFDFVYSHLTANPWIHAIRPSFRRDGMVDLALRRINAIPQILSHRRRPRTNALRARCCGCRQAAMA